ncbi:ATPase inhibitor [Coniosporium tulheliwenetii]|uniref:ATPase inhibitor n=1 Tax=Coniosporium tulheliwenetii TaxID=3383036 RepID=A0ACC2ZF93_9PEZI|nr:ATPase inhibitor [Cladosporium sp. JES 115]
MTRPALIRVLKTAAPRRLLSTTAKAMAAGDTGAARPAASALRELPASRSPCSSISNALDRRDAFTRRERSAEEMYIRQEERNKLLQLKEKLKAQRKHIDELDKHIDDLTKNQGGEHN